MTTVSTLNIAYQSFGAQAALDTLKSVSGSVIAAGEAAGQAYIDNERLSSSLTALSARELVRAGIYKDVASAQDAAAVQAQRLLGFTQQLAISSPFGQDQISQAFRLSQAFLGLSDSADKNAVSAVRMTKDLVDFAAGTGQTENTVLRVALSLGQAAASGKLMNDTAKELANSGIIAGDVIARALGITVPEATKRMSDGLIDAKTAINFILKDIEKDYGGAAARQGNTLAGVLNSLQDLGTISLRTVASPSIDVLKGEFNQLAAALQSDQVNTELQSIGQTAGTATRFIVTGVREVLPYISQMRDAAPLIASGIAGYGALQGVTFLTNGVKGLAQAYQSAAGAAFMSNREYAAYVVKSNLPLATQVITQGLAIAAVAEYWTIAAQKYTDYENQLQKGAHQILGGDERDPQIKELDARIRRSDAGITDNPQAVALDKQKQTVAQKRAALDQIQADYDKAVAANAAQLNKTSLFSGLQDSADESAYFGIQQQQAADAALKATQDAVAKGRRALDTALADVNAAQDKREELERLMGNTPPSKPAGPYAPSDEEQKLYNGLLQSRVDFGIASQDRARDYNQKLIDIDKERGSKLLDAQQSYVGKVADIDRSSANQRLDENRSYSQRLIDISKARQQALVDAAKTASTEGASALGSATAQDIDYLNGNETRLAAHVEKRRLLERQGAFCKLPEEDAAYRASERQAAQAYVNQERALQQSLGRQLIDYATAQALMRGIAQQNLDALTNAIRSQYGLQESSSERSFGRMRAVIDEWANAGGESTDGYIERLGALRDEASQTQQQIERLTKERTNALADRYSRGEIGRDDYLRQLRDIPAQVNKDVGLPNSSEPSQVLAKQKDFDQQTQQAKIAHSQRLADIDRSAGQQRADAARTYGAAVTQINGEWYTKQRTDAKDSYDKQEQQAALAYARQQKAQQDTLNKQSNDFRKYVDQHLADDARMQIGLDANAQKQLAAIQAKRAKGGSDDVTYASDLAQLVAKSKPTNYQTFLPLAAPMNVRGGNSVIVQVNVQGGIDSPARANQVANLAADKVMDRLNKQVDDTILAPPKGPR